MKTARIALPVGGIGMHEPEARAREARSAGGDRDPVEHAMLVIAYPLTTPASIPITSSIAQGFTRAELVRAICEEYSNVYDAEEGSTAASPTVPMEERLHPYKRNRTDGAYGISDTTCRTSCSPRSGGRASPTARSPDRATRRG